MLRKGGDFVPQHAIKIFGLAISSVSQIGKRTLMWERGEACLEELLRKSVAKWCNDGLSYLPHWSVNRPRINITLLR